MSILQSALNGRLGSGNAFFFSGDHFITFDWNRPTSAAGSSFSGRAVGGPWPIANAWSLTLDMQLAGFASSFDACLASPPAGTPDYAVGQMYMFKNGSYARYAYDDPPVRLPGSAGTVASWKLGATFDAGVHGAMNGKVSRLGFAYFFKGSSYSRYTWAAEQADADYPKPISGLVGMPPEFWNGVDAAIDGDAGFADFGYLFAGDRYCRFNWNQVAVDNGPLPVWQNWPGVLELLLAAQAKAVALMWLTDTAAQLAAYVGQLTTGIPSPFNTVVMEAALATHFHIPASMPAAERLANIGRIATRLGELIASLTALHDHITFHDDGEVKAHNPSYVEADGSPKYRAYTPHNGPIYLTSRFFRMCPDEFIAAAVLIHEAIHMLDAGADVFHDSPEWYLTGQPLLQWPRPDGTLQAVPYYDQLTVADALHNPSSFNAFAQHVHFTNDRRLGVEVLRPGF